jgi:acetyl-CoA acyltransferase
MREKKETKSYVVNKDEGLELELPKEALAGLRPVFEASGRVTAGTHHK